jgi:hypothetical protein
MGYVCNDLQRFVRSYLFRNKSGVCRGIPLASTGGIPNSQDARSLGCWPRSSPALPSGCATESYWTFNHKCRQNPSKLRPFGKMDKVDLVVC